MDGPGGVAEEPLDLADDVGHGEGGELDLAREVEPVDGLDQADRADLDDVLHLVARRGCGSGAAANRTREMFISMRVLRAYWYSCVPSSRTCELVEEQLRQRPSVLRSDLARVLDPRQLTDTFRRSPRSRHHVSPYDFVRLFSSHFLSPPSLILSPPS